MKTSFHFSRFGLIVLAISLLIEFTMVTSPATNLRWFDGEYSREFEAGQTFKVNELILLASADHLREVGQNAAISKLEIFANGSRVCINDSPVLGYGDCIWKPAPGKYRLQAVATDEDGGVGKSDEIAVVIERP